MKALRLMLFLAFLALISWAIADFSRMVLGASIVSAIALIGSFFFEGPRKDLT